MTLDGNDSTDIDSNGYTETTISNTIIGSGGCGGDGSVTSDGNNSLTHFLTPSTRPS